MIDIFPEFNTCEFRNCIEKGFPIIGLDYGTKRIGVAISDKLHICANPLLLYKRTSLCEDIKYIAEIFLNNNAKGIVIGIPFSHERNNSLYESIIKFGAMLKDKTKTSIYFENEDGSTKCIKKKNRSFLKKKVHCDFISASVILQRVLDIIDC